MTQAWKTLVKNIQSRYSVNQDKKHKVVIIGAGLTGLVTAFYLKKRGIDFVVLEKEDRAGGVIKTSREDGFVFEQGPNTGVVSYPEVLELFDDLKGKCEIEYADESAKRRLIWKNESWHALPSGLFSAIGTPLFTFKDKIRILGEPWRKKGENPEEVLSEMVKRRLGKSFLDYAVDPFILGIYAGDPGYLVPKYALPKLYALEQQYGSFIRGSVKKKKEKKYLPEREKRVNRQIFSVKGGLQNLIDALVDEIGMQHFVFNSGDIVVQYTKKQGFMCGFIAGNEKCSCQAEKVISTIGGHAVHQVFDFFSHEEKNVFQSLEYARVIQLSIGFEKWEGIPLNAFGGLVPFIENRDILGVLFISRFLQNRAPEQGALLSVFAGGMRHPEKITKTDEKLLSEVGAELKSMMKIPEFNPDLLKIFRYQHAIPQYGASSKERLETIAKLEDKYPGLTLAGNIRDGIGMADRVKQGRFVAESVD